MLCSVTAADISFVSFASRARLKYRLHVSHDQEFIENCVSFGVESLKGFICTGVINWEVQSLVELHDALFFCLPAPLIHRFMFWCYFSDMDSETQILGFFVAIFEYLSLLYSLILKE